jgi:hypothetical protein
MMIFGIILALIMAIPYIGWLIYLVLLPPLVIFEGRYLTQVYESGGPVALAPAAVSDSE